MSRQFKKLSLSILNGQSLNRYHKFQSFLKKNFNLIGDFRTYEELSKAGLDLDAYLVGSDQVWNPNHIGGFDPAYYLNFAEEGKKKIAYAASVGSDYIQPKYKEQIRSALSTFTVYPSEKAAYRNRFRSFVRNRLRSFLIRRCC
jgi:hypothetical protein